MRCHWIAALVVVCLLAPVVLGADTLPPDVMKNGIQAELIVTVADMDASKPARVDYEIRIRTGPDMEVEPPELIGAGESWKETRLPPEADLNENSQFFRFRLQLEQVKTGVVPLPGVRVRFRPAKAVAGDELTWTESLNELRPVPVDLPPWPPPQPPPSRTLWCALGILPLLFVVLCVSLWLLRAKKVAPPLTPQEWALRELDRIEGLGLAGPDESGWYPAEISSVIRRFLADRYGLPAQQQTTAEFLQTMRQTPELSEEQQQTLKELLERCDLAKFAALRTPTDECRRIAALARTVVQQTAPVKETAGR